MKKFLLSVTMLLAAVSSFAAEGWPANYGGVMLQAFWWDSYADTKWTALEGRADELSQYFDLIWIPNAASTADVANHGNDMGYMPCFYFNFNTCFGTEAQLRSLISTYKAKGTGIIEDVVINHKNGFMSWCSFPDETVTGKNTGKTYSVSWDNTNYTGICRNDEANSNANSGVAGKIQGNYDTGDNFDGCRDLDHTNATVQQNIKTYLDYMKNELGFAGWRYDMVKGYSATYTKIYNESCDAQFSVGEYWDSENNTKNWIDGTGKTSAAFDFDLKYNIARAFDEGNWQALGWRSFTGNADFARYSVTFVDNHDTGRTDGQGSKPLANNWSAANAYILAIPGTPCIWLKHYNADKNNIGKMILARKAAGITNQSKVINEGQKDGGYYIETQGTNGKVYVLFGGAANGSAPSGYTLVASGDAYKFYSTASSTEANVQLSPEGTSFKSETLSITATAKNATSAWYKVGNGQKTSFTGTTTITIGQGVAVGSTITVSWGATGSDGKEKTGSATYTKKDPNAATYVYFNNTQNWSSVYAYNWKNGTETNVKAWPGTQLTEKTSEGYYKYEISDDSYNMIIFNDGGSSQTDDLAVVANHLYTPNGDSGEYTSGGQGGGGGDEGDAPTFTGYRVYLNNTANWSTVNCYSWNATNTSISGAWPGSAMQKDSKTGYYYIDFSEEPTNVIFSTNGNSQTADLTFKNGNLYDCSGNDKAYATCTGQGGGGGGDTGKGTYTITYSNPNNWSSVNCYVWDAGDGNKTYLGSWPGTKMNGSGNNWTITLTVDKPLVNGMVIFNNGSDQTGDLSLSDYANYSDVTTALQAVEVVSNTDNAIYNIQGMRVANPVKGGIYIQNGRRMIMK